MNDHAPAEHAALPFCVLAPVIATDTVGFTPAAVVHAPPSDDTVTFVTNGNVRAVPFTDANVTVGAAVLIVIDCAPDVPTFVAESDCVAVIEYVPLADNAVVGVNDHDPAEHGAVPLCALAPVIATDTDALSPDATPHAPPTDVTVLFVVNGNDRAVPFTVVSVTTGAVVSTVTDFAPLEPEFAAASDCDAVIE